MLLQDKLLGIAAAVSAYIVQNRPAAILPHTLLQGLRRNYWVLCCAVLSATLFVVKVLVSATKTAIPGDDISTRSPFGGVTTWT